MVDVELCDMHINIFMRYLDLLYMQETSIMCVAGYFRNAVTYVVRGQEKERGYII